ncbi:MAG TPA: PocR ligand-binding domain-containing protein [Opitutus sp.]|nr:PocR ligand-binding domain-containing protein [Opitutus sp.]
MDTLPSSSSAATPAIEVDSDRSVVEQLSRSDIFRDYLNAFETTTGLPLALRPTGSFQSPLHRSKQVNPFCALMATNNASCASCLRMQQRIETEAADGPKTFECFAGLAEAATPVRLGEKLLGHLQTGQVLLHQPTPSRFRKIVAQLTGWGVKFDSAKFEAAYFQTRVVAKKQFDSMLRLLDVFAQHLATLSNELMVQKSAVEPPAVARARAYIAEHQDGEISLNDVARAANMSGFYFCKVFKKATGLTFTDYLARTRTERVKQLLLNPHTRVSEAAYAAGFQSLSQFNRVFRRIVGESPSDYRDRLHGPGHLLGNGGTGRALAHAA